MSQASRNLRVAIVPAERVDLVHSTHLLNLGEHLFPRTRDDFARLVEEQELFELVDDDAGADAVPVGLCYVRESPDDEHEFEFGGVYLAQQFRGRGLSEILGRCAISTQFIITAPRPEDRLVAHVHVENANPLKLLRKLGFADSQKTIQLPRAIIPANMKRDANGDVFGHEFHFNFTKLSEHAIAIEAAIDQTSGAPEVSIDVPVFVEDRDASMEALRAIAAGYRATS
jgi:ribosomal protein S18 acetylase RimI-like enzyme